MQTHGNLVVNAKHMLWANPLFESDRFLHLTPMFHSAGVANMYAQTLVAGTQITCPGFDPDLVGRMIERYQVIGLRARADDDQHVPQPSRGRPTRDLSSWRLCLYAASPIPMSLLRRAMTELPCGFSQGYGMTEMSPHCCQLAERRPRHERSPASPMPCAGSPAPARRASASTSRSAAPTARACDIGEVGEITVRGPNMMPGYWNRPDETAKVFTADGWYRTGDLASVDDGGYVFIVDRAKDMIVSGGENVYTTEVENALASHPAVLELAVFGVPHEQWGEAVQAEVVLKAGATRDRARADRPLPGDDRRLQGAACDRRPRAAAAQVGRRQDPQARRPRPVLGRPRAHDLNRVDRASGRLNP